MDWFLRDVKVLVIESPNRHVYILGSIFEARALLLLKS
jgi:hypothetical protein